MFCLALVDILANFGSDQVDFFLKGISPFIYISNTLPDEYRTTEPPYIEKSFGF